MRFLLAILLLGIALILQFLFSFDFAFAVLIAFAVALEFWELLFLILCSVFFLNWQPAPSLTIAVIALYPLVVFASHRFFRWQGWFGMIVSIAVGIFILTLAANPEFIVHDAAMFVLDILLGMGLGAIGYGTVRATSG